MPSRYHPIEDGLWDDPKFDGDLTRNLPDAPFIERAFFAYLCSNPRQRPSGIYRATDTQLAGGSRLPEVDVASIIQCLHSRSLIVRDGNWLFLPGYLRRQKKGPRLLEAAELDVQRCSSVLVLEAFTRTYPLYSNWLPTEFRLSNPLCSTNRAHQSRAVPEQSRAEQKEIGSEAKSGNGLPEWFRKVLASSPTFCPLLEAKHADFWKAMSEAYDPYEWLKWDEQIQLADAWIAANPQKKPRALPRFLRNWFERTVERERKYQHAKR